MIPKKIHYCWFGKNRLPEQTKKYINTWKKHCPEYEILEWNESNFDVNQNLYCKEAFEAKKWAFVSDFVRLKVLYEHGGVYLDTDVEIVKNMDDLLALNFFSGLESESSISTAVIGAEKSSEIIEKFLLVYNDIHFYCGENLYDYTTNVKRFSEFIKKEYKKDLSQPPIMLFDKAVIYDIDFFCAKSIYDGRIEISENTYMIHHFSGSWLDSKRKIKSYIKLLIGKIFGVKIVKLIKNIIK